MRRCSWFGRLCVVALSDLKGFLRSAQRKEDGDETVRRKVGQGNQDDIWDCFDVNLCCCCSLPPYQQSSGGESWKFQYSTVQYARCTRGWLVLLFPGLLHFFPFLQTDSEFLNSSADMLIQPVTRSPLLLLLLLKIEPCFLSKTAKLVARPDSELQSKLQLRTRMRNSPSLSSPTLSASFGLVSKFDSALQNKRANSHFDTV